MLIRVVGPIGLFALACSLVLGAQDLPIFQKQVDVWTARVIPTAAPNDEALELIANGPLGRERRAQLPLLIRAIEDVVLSPGGKFILVDKDAGAQHLAIIPVSPQQPNDLIVSYQYAISPDRRFVAFRKHFPRFGFLSDSAVYLAYDTTLSPAANRMEGGWPPPGEFSDRVGWAFYPTENRGGSYEPIGDTRHHLASPLTWADAHRLVFVDYSEGTSRLVLADFSRGVSSSIITERILDTRAIVDTAKVAKDIDPASTIVAESLVPVLLPGGALEVRVLFRVSPVTPYKVSDVTVRF